MHYIVTWAHVWWAALRNCARLKARPLYLTRLLFIYVCACKWQVDSFLAVTKTASTGSSSVTGGSVGVSTKTEEKWPDRGFVASQIAVSVKRFQMPIKNRSRIRGKPDCGECQKVWDADKKLIFWTWKLNAVRDQCRSAQFCTCPRCMHSAQGFLYVKGPSPSAA